MWCSSSTGPPASRYVTDWEPEENSIHFNFLKFVTNGVCHMALPHNSAHCLNSRIVASIVEWPWPCRDLNYCLLTLLSVLCSSPSRDFIGVVKPINRLSAKEAKQKWAKKTNTKIQLALSFLLCGYLGDQTWWRLIPDAAERGVPYLRGSAAWAWLSDSSDCHGGWAAHRTWPVVFSVIRRSISQVTHAVYHR